MTNSQLSLQEARCTAVKMASAEVLRFFAVAPAEILSTLYMEAEGCWVFFVNEQVLAKIPVGALLCSAYAVAKRGEKRALVYDFRSDMKKMQRYVEIWSLHALNEDELAASALKSFNDEFPPADEPNPI